MQCGICPVSIRKLSMPYACLIPCSIHADFTQTSMHNAMREHCEIHSDTLRNPCGIYALFMLYSMQPADFTQSSRRFHADFHAECDAESLRIPCGIPCSMQFSRKFHADFTGLPCGMRCGIFPASMLNLSMPYACLILCKMQISLILLGRMRNRIFAESIQVLCGIRAESIYALSMFDFLQHADFTYFSRGFHRDFLAECDAESYAWLIICSMQFWRKFHADFTQTSIRNAMQNLCRIHAESIYALYLLDSMQRADFTQTSIQNSMRNLYRIHAESIYALSILDSMQHADFTLISRRIHTDFNAERGAESLRNPCGIYALCMFVSMQHADFPQISRRFYADFHVQCDAESSRNPCGIDLCLMLDSMQHADFTQNSRRFYADFNAECLTLSLRHLCGIFAESMRNLSMPFYA